MNVGNHANLFNNKIDLPKVSEDPFTGNSQSETGRDCILEDLLVCMVLSHNML